MATAVVNNYFMVTVNGQLENAEVSLEKSISTHHRMNEKTFVVRSVSRIRLHLVSLLL